MINESIEIISDHKIIPDYKITFEERNIPKAISTNLVHCKIYHHGKLIILEEYYVNPNLDEYVYMLDYITCLKEFLEFVTNSYNASIYCGEEVKNLFDYVLVINDPSFKDYRNPKIFPQSASTSYQTLFDFLFFVENLPENTDKIENLLSEKIDRHDLSEEYKNSYIDSIKSKNTTLLYTEINDFIKTFRESFIDSESIYTNGKCLEFSVYLEKIFGGVIYSNIDHCIFKYQDKFYDINGDITHLVNSESGLYRKEYVPITEYGVGFIMNYGNKTKKS